MANFKIATLPEQPRVELHDLLALTGAEISVNDMAPNTAVPFVHAHKQNEEIYLVIGGSGLLYIDGEEVAIKQGDAFRIDPAGHRCLKAGADGLKIICVQVKQNSLEGFTFNDGVPCEEKAFAQ